MTQQYDVTSVGVNPAKDRAHRMRVYFLAMALRVLCIVSLFWLRGWWVVIAALGAILLPYFAVIIANAVSHQVGPAASAPAPLALESTEHEGPSNSEHASSPAVIVVDAPAERRSANTANAANAASDPGTSGAEDPSERPPEASQGAAE